MHGELAYGLSLSFLKKKVGMKNGSISLAKQ